MSRHRRGPRSYRRGGPIREAYATVVIACEGSKTEPSYFRRLCAVYTLSSANVRVVHGQGTDPLSIVQFGEQFLADTDKVYCVFDRDQHATYEAALQRVANSAAGQQERLVAIPSWPCFEIWLLLHFAYSAAPITAMPGNSACAEVIRKLKAHFPAYEKGHVGIFDAFAHKLDEAIKHAGQLTKHNRETGSSNPSTLVHDLVIYLRKLKA